MTIRFLPPCVVLVLVGVLVGLAPAQTDSMHRNGFGGKVPSFVRGDANIPFAEQEHAISDKHAKNGPTSEYLRIEANPPGGAAEAQYVHYHYETPVAPITERMTASVHIKALRAGIQVKARVVFPKEKDPRNPDALLTTLVAGDTYTDIRRWQQLGFGAFPDLLRKHLPVLHARLGRAVDPSGAYVDRIVLNVFGGPGVTDVWIDDLEIGPVKSDPLPLPKPKDPPGGLPAGRGAGKARAVEFSDGQILVDDKPFFMLAVRHSDTPLKTLRDANFNTIWFPNEVPQPTLDEAIRQGFWIVPSLPIPGSEFDERMPVKPDPFKLEKEADALSKYLRKFLAADAVLMWDLGSDRTAEDLSRVARSSDIVRTYDPRRPRSVDLLDGFSAYSTYVNSVGSHRWPLFSSLELTAYRDWLNQRKALTSPGKMTWTWIQTHLPEWYVAQLTGKTDVAAFEDPIGPHPEQIRILTYLALAAGHRGLGFWSDKFLANSHHGRDRLLELALLNAEIDMLQEVLFSAQDPARWVPTSDGNVQAAVIRGPKEILVLPVYLGAGSQHVPPQSAIPTLTVTIPAVPEGTTPWLITPAYVSELKGVRRVAGGTQIDIPEFDTTAAVVFTSDLGVAGKVVRWQDHTRFEKGRQAAQWALQQAIEQFNKAHATHAKILQAGGPDLPNNEAAELFKRSRESMARSKDYAETRQWDMAYKEARRSLRPIRVLMRAHWEKAVATLDVSTASPFAASFFSLPQHWQFAAQIAASRPGGNGFAHGGFELSKPAPKEGAAVASLPGWKVRKVILDPVNATAAIINMQESLKDLEPKAGDPGTNRYGAQRIVPRTPAFRQPDFGQHLLMLKLDAKPEVDPKGKALPPPQALERAVLAVDSPPAEFAPGSIVRISFWVRIFTQIEASPDGVVVFDSAGGEPLGVRIGVTAGWREFHLYRRVPASGKIALTFALTGLGEAFFDDVRIEPMVPYAAAVAPTNIVPVGKR